jgi:hypothetical protein
MTPELITILLILILTGKEGWGDLTREKVREPMLHKAGRKYQHG